MSTGIDSTAFTQARGLITSTYPVSTLLQESLSLQRSWRRTCVIAKGFTLCSF